MDSIQGITYDPDNRPGVANLLSIYGALTDETPETVAEHFADKGNAALKDAVADVVIDALRPFQQRYHELMDHQDYLRQILQRGAKKRDGALSLHCAQPTRH